jgi:hypothetical protein
MKKLLYVCEAESGGIMEYAIRQAAAIAREGAVSENLLSCYEALVQKEIFPFKELDLVKAWMGALN